MAYASAAELLASYPWVGGLGSADDRAAALEVASADLDAELARAWAVPLAGAPPLVIVEMVKRRAAWVMLQRGGQNPAEDAAALQRAVEEDFGRLKRIVAAKILPGLQESGPAVVGAEVRSDAPRGWGPSRRWQSERGW